MTDISVIDIKPGAEPGLFVGGHRRKTTRTTNLTLLGMPGRAERGTKANISGVILGRSKERSDARRPWNPCRDAKALLRLQNISAPLRSRQESRHGSSGQARRDSAPLCPAGHLPPRGADWPWPRLSPIVDVALTAAPASRSRSQCRAAPALPAPPTDPAACASAAPPSAIGRGRGRGRRHSSAPASFPPACGG